MKLFQTHLDLLLGIITALLKTCQYFLIIRRGESHMVNLSSLRIGTPANNAFNQDLVRDIEKKEAVSRHARGSKCIGLCRRTRKSIKEPSSLLAVSLIKTVLDHSNDNIVGNKFARIHVLLGELSNLSLIDNGSTEHIACREMDDTILFLDHFTLRSLAACRSTSNDNFERIRNSFANSGGPMDSRCCDASGVPHLLRLLGGGGNIVLAVLNDLKVLDTINELSLVLTGNLLESVKSQETD
mmetsp:Transcript_1518/g.3622  ORF Transcript_1518/g.3622 Transcript_1518/m.3622 type:complete len:241 (+) Transcript_1518:183-905(+)